MLSPQKVFRKSALIFCICVLKTHAAMGLTLAWDYSGYSSVPGYHVYYGRASGVYTQKLTVQNATQVTVPNLAGGQTYFFVVTAWDGNGNESVPSNEVLYTAPIPSTTNVIPFVMD